MQESGREAYSGLVDLNKTVRTQEAELQVYREFGKQSFTSLNFPLKLERLIEIVLSSMDLDLGVAFLVSKKGDKLSLSASKGVLAGEIYGELPAMMDGAAGRVIETGKPIMCTSLIGEPVWLNNMKRYSERATIAVPLRLRDKVTGVLQVIGSEDGVPFDADDAEFLNTLTKQFSIIAQKSYVFNDLEDRIKDSSALSEVGNLLISTLHESEIRFRAMTAITSLMEVEAGSMLLLDEERGDLYFDVAIGKRGEKVKDLRLDVGEGLAGWVAKHNKALLINDVTEDDRFESRIDNYSSFTTRNALCVPVMAKGKLIGVLEAINKVNGNFTEKDLEIFKLFSHQVAIALDNARLYAELRQTFIATSEALAESIDKRDPYTGGHTKRVVRYSLVIGERMKLSSDILETLKLSAILHDIGKIGIDDAILRKEGPLNDEEFEIMKTHPTIGADIMGRIPQLKEVLPGTLYHHERVDGKGYPGGFSGEGIPLIARVISVADTYDAMTTTRAYRKGLSREVAIAELLRCSGTQFDPIVVETFIAAIEAGEIEDIKLVSFSEL